MAKQKFDRSKPHVNIGTIGHIDHGKSPRFSRKKVSLNMNPTRTLTRLRKNANAALRLTLRTLSTRLKNATMLTSTARVTLTISRT